LKKAHPADRMKRQLDIHNYFIERFVPEYDANNSDEEYTASRESVN